MTTSILVTGGAGYIGSHVVRQLVERGERVVVLDNLSTGYRSAVLGAPLVVGNTGDPETVDRVLAERHVETVMHFAAHTIVPESVSNPLKYYGNNTCPTRNLLGCCDRGGVNHLVFSAPKEVRKRPPEEELTKNRTESYSLALAEEQREAKQSLIASMVAIIISTVILFLHWKLANYARKEHTA